MFPLYTIGLLGSHPATTDTVEYFKFALQYYCGSMSAFRLLVAVSAPDDLMFCHALLELKKTIPGLQLTMVLAEQYRQEHDTALLYGQIRKKADSIVELSVPIYAYFIERCDFIIFNKRTAGASIAARFQKALVGIPIPVQHELCDPGFFVLCTPYPIERKEYLNPDSRHYDPYAELRQSIEYIQRQKIQGQDKPSAAGVPAPMADTAAKKSLSAASGVGRHAGTLSAERYGTEQLSRRQNLCLYPYRKEYALDTGHPASRRRDLVTAIFAIPPSAGLGSLPERPESDIETGRPVPPGSIRNRNT